MYKIIGADQKEYGPVSLEQLRLWLAQGRVNAQTKVLAAGQTEWQQMSALPEFASGAPPVSPPPVADAAVTGGAPQNTSALAISSLALGVLGLLTCGITSVIGLVLGIVALIRIRSSQGRLGGSGLAISGIVVSIVLCLVVPLIAAALVVPAYTRTRERVSNIQCTSNMRQLALAVRLYAEDHNQQFPPATTWCDAIQAQVGHPSVFVCPGTPGVNAYGFNSHLSGRKLNEVDARTVLLFESNSGWNASGGPELAALHPHSKRMFNIAFVDGSTRQVSQSELNTLRWEP